MKIKFLKPFRLYNPIGDDMMIAEGAIENMEKEDYAQWLIDNGFAEKAEKVKESGWKPEIDDTYYYVRYTLSISDWENIGYRIWEDDEDDESRYLIGNVFKTEESAQRFIDYLEAVETVRHDEGFMKQDKTYGEVWALRRAYLNSEKFFTARRIDYEGVHNPGAFYFDTEEHAIASSEKHPSEWETILNYDWSKE